MRWRAAALEPSGSAIGPPRSTCQHDRLEGRRRLTAHRRRRRAVEESGGAPLHGPATLSDGKTVIVAADTGEARIRCDHWSWRPARSRRRCRRCRSAARSSPDRGAGPDRASRVAGRDRRRLHRPRARHGVREARRRGRVVERWTGAAALRRGADAAGRAAYRDSASRLCSARGRRARGQPRSCVTDGGERAAAGRQVLVAVGRRPLTQGFGLDALDLAMRARSCASTSAARPRCATSGRSATSPASRCSPIAPWRRARWSPRSSPARSAPSTRSRSPR